VDFGLRNSDSKVINTLLVNSRLKAPAYAEALAGEQSSNLDFNAWLAGKVGCRAHDLK
jgi:hypothetical protein